MPSLSPSIYPSIRVFLHPPNPSCIIILPLLRPFHLDLIPSLLAFALKRILISLKESHAKCPSLGHVSRRLPGSAAVDKSPIDQYLPRTSPPPRSPTHQSNSLALSLSLRLLW